MHTWMTELGLHFERVRLDHPGDPLLVLFDIDGTILDTRHLVRYVLRAYDEEHGQSFFRDLRVEDIDVHEDELPRLLERLPIPLAARTQVLRWYLEHHWQEQAVLDGHRPFRGVLEVICWFQLQENTFVGLNTGRSEDVRAATLHCLNALGREFRVRFSDDLLAMNPAFGEVEITRVKVENLRRFQERGFRVVAMVDNEPENLAALAAAYPEGELLLLHADTIFSSRQASPHACTGTHHRRLPRRSLSLPLARPRPKSA